MRILVECPRIAPLPYSIQDSLPQGHWGLPQGTSNEAGCASRWQVLSRPEGQVTDTEKDKDSREHSPTPKAKVVMGSLASTVTDHRNTNFQSTGPLTPISDFLILVQTPPLTCKALGSVPRTHKFMQSSGQAFIATVTKTSCQGCQYSCPG